MPSLTPQVVDRRWGPSVHHRYDVLQHPVRDHGGNPAIIWRHGSFGGSDKRVPWIASGAGNALAHYLNQSAREVHFDFISVGLRQGAWNNPSDTHPSNASIGWYDEPIDGPTHYPDTFEDMKRAILAIKSAAYDLGINPGRLIVGGDSAGADVAFHSQFTEPWYRDYAGPVGGSSRFRDGDGFDSRVQGILWHRGQPDFRYVTGTSTETHVGSVWQNLFGTFTDAERAALPTHLRDAVSPLAYLERGDTRWAVPLYAMYDSVGVGVTTKPYSDAHNSTQFYELRTGFERAGLAHLFSGVIYNGWSDSNTVNRDRTSAEVFSWLKSVVDRSETRGDRTTRRLQGVN